MPELLDPARARSIGRALALIALSCLAFAVNGVLEWRERDKWPLIAAEVVKLDAYHQGGRKGHGDYARVGADYRYTVDGRQHSGFALLQGEHVTSFGDARTREEALSESRIREGQTVRPHYNPENPAENFLYSELTTDDRVLLVYGTIFLVASVWWRAKVSRGWFR